MSVNVKQTLALPWQCPHAPAGGISCLSPCTVILTGIGTDLLTLGCRVGHEMSFLFLLGHSSYLGAAFFYRRDAVVSLPSSVWSWRGEVREVL